MLDDIRVVRDREAENSILELWRANLIIGEDAQGVLHLASQREDKQGGYHIIASTRQSIEDLLLKILTSLKPIENGDPGFER